MLKGSRTTQFQDKYLKVIMISWMSYIYLYFQFLFTLEVEFCYHVYIVTEVAPNIKATVLGFNLVSYTPQFEES